MSRALDTLLSCTAIEEVMTREVVCVTEELSVEALGTLLLERGIDGVPVVDAQGFPLGVVSKTDLLRDRAGATVGQIMTRTAFTLPETSPIGDAVTLMAVEGVHRVPAVDQEGRVTGVVSTLDLLHWLDDSR
jgi:CBS domain-containing protein